MRTALPAPTAALGAALAYAARGLHVFPCWELTPDGGDCVCPARHPSRDGHGNCGSPGKHPRTPNGVKDATTDPAQLERWWTQWPRAHVAIATGTSGLLVVDVDPRNGGDASLAELEQRHGSLPETPRQLTGGGGVHIFFRRPDRPHVRGPRHGLGQGLDVKGDNGYVIAWPSGHLSGRPYAWEIGHDLADLPLADPPAWLLDILDTRAVAVLPKASTAVTDGLLGAALQIAGWLGRPLGPDKAACRCPQEDLHSVGSRLNGSTIVYAPSKPGGLGFVYCSHGHCRDLTGEAVLAALPAAAVAQARADMSRRGIRAVDPPTDAPPPGDGDAPPEPPHGRHAPLGKRQRAGAGDLAAILTTDPQWAGCVAADVFADTILWVKPPPVVPGLARPQVGERLRDAHLVYMNRWAATALHWSVGLDVADAALRAAAEANPVHPARAALESLTWDQTPRLATWLARYAGAPDSPTTTAIGVWTLVAAVARLFQPGCQADHILVLEGVQGIGKSELIRCLAGPYYAPQLPHLLGERPGQELQGRWIIEIAELDAFHGVTVSRIKDFISRPIDVFRPSYGRHTVTRPRQCIFIGTTNDSTYLRDASGARRFWPVLTTTIDLPALHRDRDQLWAEAVTEYRNGTPWWPDPSWHPQLAELQDDRYEADPWEPLVAAHLADLSSTSANELLADVLHLPPDRWDRPAQMRVADILRRLGWARRRSGPESRRVWRWFPPVRPR